MDLPATNAATPSACSFLWECPFSHLSKSGEHFEQAIHDFSTAWLNQSGEALASGGLNLLLAGVHVIIALLEICPLVTLVEMCVSSIFFNPPPVIQTTVPPNIPPKKEEAPQNKVFVKDLQDLIADFEVEKPNRFLFAKIAITASLLVEEKENDEEVTSLMKSFIDNLKNDTLPERLLSLQRPEGDIVNLNQPSGDSLEATLSIHLALQNGFIYIPQDVVIEEVRKSARFYEIPWIVQYCEKLILHHLEFASKDEINTLLALYHKGFGGFGLFFTSLNFLLQKWSIKEIAIFITENSYLGTDALEMCVNAIREKTGIGYLTWVNTNANLISKICEIAGDPDYLSVDQKIAKVDFSARLVNLQQTFLACIYHNPWVPSRSESTYKTIEDVPMRTVAKTFLEKRCQMLCREIYDALAEALKNDHKEAYHYYLHLIINHHAFFKIFSCEILNSFFELTKEYVGIFLLEIALKHNPDSEKIEPCVTTHTEGSYPYSNSVYHLEITKSNYNLYQGLIEDYSPEPDEAQNSSKVEENSLSESTLSFPAITHINYIPIYTTGINLIDDYERRKRILINTLIRNGFVDQIHLDKPNHLPELLDCLEDPNNTVTGLHLNTLPVEFIHKFQLFERLQNKMNLENLVLDTLYDVELQQSSPIDSACIKNIDCLLEKHDDLTITINNFYISKINKKSLELLVDKYPGRFQFSKDKELNFTDV